MHVIRTLDIVPMRGVAN